MLGATEKMFLCFRFTDFNIGFTSKDHAINKMCLNDLLMDDDWSVKLEAHRSNVLSNEWERCQISVTLLFQCQKLQQLLEGGSRGLWRLCAKYPNQNQLLLLLEVSGRCADILVLFGSDITVYCLGV